MSQPQFAVLLSVDSPHSALKALVGDRYWAAPDSMASHQRVLSE